MNSILRIIQNQIVSDFGKGKLIIVYGARQVGKTTLVKKIFDDYSSGDKYFYRGDDLKDREAFSNASLTELEGLVSKYTLVVIDEAQRITNIGLSLKLIVDNFPKVTVIATGSSSFDLANKISEPLTGRFFKYDLHPISEYEIISSGISPFEEKNSLESRLIYGMYPEILTNNSVHDKTRLISNIASNYLFNDILEFEKIKSSDLLVKLLQALALQIGQEVSYAELAQIISVDRKTVINYIDLLEKAFIIYKIRGFSRNLRKEINKTVKIYFNDLGIRNALINNFNKLEIRQDRGELFENFIINELIKTNAYQNKLANYYFWRTYDQQEIDLITDSGGELNGYEIKYSRESFTKNKLFLESYKNSQIFLINKENYLDFVT